MKISTGIVKQPFFVVLYGTEGIGKTGFAKDAGAHFLDIEGGSKQYNVSRHEGFSKYEDVLESLTFLRKEKHDFKTLSIDTLDAIEPLLWEYLCKKEGKSNIEEVGGGFQKGYNIAADHWRMLIAELNAIRAERNMNIIAIAHARVITVNDPTQQTPYDRYTLKLHENKNVSIPAIWRQAADAVLFATYQDTVFKVAPKDKKGKSSGGGVKKLFTTRTSAYDAKNRLGLPSEMSFSFEEFEEKRLLGQPDSLEQIKIDLAELRERHNDDQKKRFDTAIEKAGTDLHKLSVIRNHARVLVGDE